MTSFTLVDSDLFIYRYREPNWGWNGLGRLAYYRTYSRDDHGYQEHWFDTVRRVVEGTFEIQRRYTERHGLPWDRAERLDRALQMFDAIFYMRFLPPGRGLWSMGAPVVMERGIGDALVNCGYTSSYYPRNPSRPFGWAMNELMLGVGVGFDVEGAGTPVGEPGAGSWDFVIPDSREGWVASLELLLDSYFKGNPAVYFDYSLVRPYGAPIRGFGGVASGPEPLRQLHEDTRNLLEDAHQRGHLSITDIADLFNMIGRTVVAGNVRRSAEISLGPNVQEFLSLKDIDINADRCAKWGWASNNSVISSIGENYETFAPLIAKWGEPGVYWRENALRYGRMGEELDSRNLDIKGINPCGEIPLASFETCDLVETVPMNHSGSLAEYLRTLSLALEYAKTVTLVPSVSPETAVIVANNRRLGIGQTGIQQFVAAYGADTWAHWSNMGYQMVRALDRRLSARWDIPTSIALTCVKPSGTVSLLSGSTPGIHWNVSDRYHIRRVRLAEDHWAIPALQEAGFPMEPDLVSARTTVIEWPVDAGTGTRSEAEVPLREQMAAAALAQRVWSDNAVSATGKFKAGEAKEIPALLREFETQLKAYSFLPNDGTVYAQQPYESITREEYERRSASVRQPRFVDVEHDSDERYCDGDACSLPA